MVVLASFVLHRADYVGRGASPGACQMDDMRFAGVMQRERERLNHEREQIFSQQKGLEHKIAEFISAVEWVT
jgi:hypothetical protein